MPQLARSKTPAPPEPFRFTRSDYYRLGEVGIIAHGERVELLEGEIVRMSPIGYRHAVVVARFAKALTRGVGDRADVWVQSPVVLDDLSEPEPDVALVRTESERTPKDHPWARDAYVIVEVADTSLRHDRDVKVPLYAAAGVPEVWLIDLAANSVTVYRDARQQARMYSTITQHQPGGSLSPEAFPDIRLNLADVLR